METPYLFVYGTLMSTARGFMGQAQRERLGNESVAIGAGCVAGRLYNLGRYPGFVAPDLPAISRPALGVQQAGSEVAPEVVYGEVVELKSPRQSLRWLDAYEGVSGDGGRAGDEYLRRQFDVALIDANEASGTLSAWLYIYQGRFDPRMQVSSGRWSVR